MEINVSNEIEYMIGKIHTIVENERVTPKTKLEAIDLLGKVVDMAIQINRVGMLMEGLTDDGK